MTSVVSGLTSSAITIQLSDALVTGDRRAALD